GLELVRKLRDNADLKDTPVIMLTARGFAIEDGLLEDIQISEFLSKPFSPKELLRSIEDILYHQEVTKQA
ncbi:MAG: response regulator, partial [Planctomycetota bacterium]